MNEFTAQGQTEKKLGMKVSPMMDPDEYEKNLPQSQLAFIDYIVTPIFHTWNNVSRSTATPIKYLTKNRDFWKQELDKYNKKQKK